MNRTFYSHLDYPGNGTMSDLFSRFYNMTEVDNPKDADIIIWNGGEDIATSIYLEEPIGRGIPFKRSARDSSEIKMFDEYKNDPKKFLLGICRGAQLLNCLNGGKLYQDVSGHNRSHNMIDLRSNEIVNVTSTHHQQMIIAPTGGELIGVSSCSSYKHSASGTEHPVLVKDLIKGKDVEIVWYPKTRTLCIQGHPEYVPGSRFAAYTLELLDQLYYGNKESVSSAA